MKLLIQWNAQAEAVLNSMVTLDRRVLVTIARAVDRENQLTVSYIQQRYLSFPKNGPTRLSGLRVITNRLRGSLRASRAEIDGQTVRSSIGSNVKYAALHEFGGIVHHAARSGVVRLRTNKNGLLLRQADGKLAIFARRTQKLAREVNFSGKAYDVIYPERMPVRRGINDRRGDYSRSVSNAVVEAARQ